MQTPNELASRVLERARPGARQLWQPHPDNAPQCLAWELAQQVDELGYGGQAGGGKTDLALGLAGAMFRNSLLIRREFPQLEGIIDRGNELYPTTFVAGYKRRWEFDSHVITLGSLQHEKDWRKYQGRARDYIAVDEASELPERSIRAITGWLRTTERGRKTLLLLTFNPPTTPEGEWIIKYFGPWLDPEHPNPARDGEIRWFANIDGESVEVPDGKPFMHRGLEIHPISRTFVAASRHDNPFLGDDYERRLQNLPEPLRTILTTGDMTIRQDDDEWQVIPTAWVLEAQYRWEQMDRPAVAMRCMGVDVARGGPDNTVISRLYGTYFDDLITLTGVQTSDGLKARDAILRYWEEGSGVFVDAVGYGASAFDHLARVPGVHAVAVNAGERATAKDKSGKFEFANLRAQMYWQLREALDPTSGEEIALPPDRELRVELCAARYRTTGGKIALESKDDIKKRLNRSPDKADAVVMAWYGAGHSVKRKIEWW